MPPKKATQTKAIPISTTIPISQPSNTRYADNRERRMTRHDYPLATPMGLPKGGVLRVASGGSAVVRSRASGTSEPARASLHGHRCVRLDVNDAPVPELAALT
jgi:hypothetical protein